nr:MAG TPA: hypothetical protein [Caudoviricetes sp.]
MQFILRIIICLLALGAYEQLKHYSFVYFLNNA